MSAIDPLKAPVDPLPIVATYPAGDTVACAVICAVVSTAPSTYKVAVWVKCPEDVAPGVRVRAA